MSRLPIFGVTACCVQFGHPSNHIAGDKTFSTVAIGARGLPQIIHFPTDRVARKTCLANPLSSWLTGSSSSFELRHYSGPARREGIRLRARHCGRSSTTLFTDLAALRAYGPRGFAALSWRSGRLFSMARALPVRRRAFPSKCWSLTGWVIPCRALVRGCWHRQCNTAVTRAFKGTPTISLSSRHSAMPVARGRGNVESSGWGWTLKNLRSL
ncbi:MAG: hypothetical protein GAK45_00551 [Pseudomonas citronellolis]|nr:MAG: hypothetical protein GAK45_00551 [Pseudomonas citronellolis]